MWNLTNTSLSGNGTRKSSSSSIRDFTILEHFKVTIHHPNAPIIKEIIWHPPLPATLMELQKEILAFLLVVEFSEIMQLISYAVLLNHWELFLLIMLSFVVL
ncbi:hypothetical protein A2U01_0010330 [Trifolium medium]|uniref:Uncharacterized protein n=1 Tax=Trifolium medium TaxID=97028 RepID=A0A392MT37_9FABA|nr:hypothetical protein [Trifolium medium]